MNERAVEVGKCIEDTKRIFESCMELVSLRLKALQRFSEASSEEDIFEPSVTVICNEEILSFAMVLREQVELV